MALSLSLGEPRPFRFGPLLALLFNDLLLKPAKTQTRVPNDIDGESGPRARAMDESWAHQLREIYARDDVAFFFKQWGGARPKSGGRLLDGEKWNGFPWQIVPKPILDQISHEPFCAEYEFL